MDGIRLPECIENAFGTYLIDNKHHTSALDSNNIDKSAFSRIWSNAAEHPMNGPGHPKSWAIRNNFIDAGVECGL